MKFRLIILPIVFSGIAVFCQETKSTDINLEKLIDEIFPVQDEDFNYAELYEVYGQLLANPLNLNSASETQIQSLLILNSAQLFDFLQYRKENGPLISLYELQVIPSFNVQIIRLLEPFVTIGEVQPTGWKNLLTRIRNEDNNYFVARAEQTLEKKAGYRESSSPAIQYAGSPTKLYNRFRINSNGDFSFGFTTEKDAGEKLIWNPSANQLGFDFLSAHAQVQNKGVLKNLLIGDYQAQFGQGLTLGGGFGMGKGSETITTMQRSNLGFIPYTSVAEYGFFRGVATSATLTPLLKVHSFYSQTHRDGNGATINDAGNYGTVSSLALTGFHRTENEIQSRKNLEEINWGTVIQASSEKFDAGIIMHHTEFSSAINRNPTPYNQFAFNGDNNTNLGFYWNQTFRNFTFFSEASHSVGAGNAMVVGFLTSLSQSLDMSMLYRNYERNYNTFYPNAISENSTPQNEKGIYWGWKYRFSKVHTLSGYIDLFQFPWLRFRSYRPSEGNEWMFRYSYNPSKSTLLYIQVRQENKVRNLSVDSPQYITGIGSKTNFWINADYKVNTNLSFKTRAQFVTYGLIGSTSKGVAVIQDINYSWQSLTLSARYALFQTDGYDTRLYAYEKDAWLSFSIPAYQGIGTRRYILVQYKVSRKIDIWFRWASTVYENQNTIGSGGELINGNTRNDFKVQSRIRF